LLGAQLTSVKRHRLASADRREVLPGCVTSHQRRFVEDFGTVVSLWQNEYKASYDGFQRIPGPQDVARHAVTFEAGQFTCMEIHASPSPYKLRAHGVVELYSQY